MSLETSHNLGQGFLKYYCRTELNLYYTPGSPPCRSVLLTAKALGLELNLKTVDLFNNEHMKPEFLKLNPQHSIPTLQIGEFVMWESRAIIVYLVQAYGEGDNPLFPKDKKKQARINQTMQFDLGTLYPVFQQQYYPWLFNKQLKTKDKEQKLHNALGFLETFLGSNDWVAGDSMTLADMALVASISTFEVAGVDLKSHEKVSKWLQRCKTTMKGYKDANQNGVERFKTLVDNKLANSVAQKEQGIDVGEIQEHDIVLVTNYEVLKATKILIRAAIGEEYSEMLNQLKTAMEAIIN
ncbi:glutathione S-transferase 1-1-like [Metopolophium dirhodum]|uniref:glutathione S-transferase 1-1-like n=1 Tax=Metopolophium dirhodum TaxID=44670 RepID=UPI00298F8226|nr:glutathione S-transferase 1-1-like [Metopolophium dirhodum]